MHAWITCGRVGRLEEDEDAVEMTSMPFRDDFASWCIEERREAGRHSRCVSLGLRSACDAGAKYAQRLGGVARPQTAETGGIRAQLPVR
jgi:hypothetical protein